MDKELLRTHSLFVLLYAPALVALGIYVYLLESPVAAYVMGVVVAYVVVQYLIGGRRHVFVGIVSTYLLASVVSDVTLLRVRSVPMMPAWVLYTVLAFIAGLAWSISAGVATRTLGLRFVRAKWLLRVACVTALVLSAFLYVSVTPHSTGLVLEPALIIGLSAFLAALILAYDSLLFHKVLAMTASTEVSKGGDEPLFTQFLTFFALTLSIVVILIPNLKPGERPYLGLGIGFSYLYASLALSFVASLFMNHGAVLDVVAELLGSVEGGREGFLHSCLADFYRLRYPSALINLFNYVESLGNEGRSIMSVNLSDAFEEGIKLVKPALRGVKAARKAGDVLKELRELRIIEVRKEIHDSLASADPTGRLVKAFESRILKAYLSIIAGDESKLARELKQIRGELRAALREARKRGDEEVTQAISGVLEEVKAGNADLVTHYVIERPAKLRDLRNHLVHGRLSREYVIKGGKLVKGLEVLRKPVMLYLMTSSLIAYVASRLKHPH